MSKSVWPASVAVQATPIRRGSDGSSEAESDSKSDSVSSAWAGEESLEHVAGKVVEMFADAESVGFHLVRAFFLLLANSVNLFAISGQ